MAVRQYVGARYVPKFYQNSQNPLSSEWEGNVAYEALTVVTYNNSSYTSKIPVPAGIGNPASNPTYWVVTGAYNAQVEQYRQEVDTAVTNVNEQLNQTTTNLENKLNDNQTKLEGEMQTLKTDTETSIKDIEDKTSQAISEVQESTPSWWGAGKKIVIYGDSTTVVENAWPKFLTGATITNRGEGGQALNQTISTIQSHDDNATFDYAIVACGINNWQGSNDLLDIMNGTQQIVDLLTPVTSLLFVTPFYSVIPDFANNGAKYGVTNLGTALEYYVRAQCEVLLKNGVPCYNPYFTMGVNYNNYMEFMNNDTGDATNHWVHENEKLGRKMANAIMHWDFSTTLPADIKGTNLINAYYANCYKVTEYEPTQAALFDQYPASSPFFNAGGYEIEIPEQNTTAIDIPIGQIYKGQRLKFQCQILGNTFGLQLLDSSNGVVFQLLNTAGTGKVSYNLVDFEIPKTDTYTIHTLTGASNTKTYVRGLGVYADFIRPARYTVTSPTDENTVYANMEVTDTFRFSPGSIELTAHAFSANVAGIHGAVNDHCYVYGYGIVTTNDGATVTDLVIAGGGLFVRAQEGTLQLQSIVIAPPLTI